MALIELSKGMRKEEGVKNVADILKKV